MFKLLANLLSSLTLLAATASSQACLFVFWDEEKIPDCLIK
ncbi:MAG: cyclic lactone autoinducer peptide [Bacilli bacterium]|nr:cyclic lactone autoinducer peptide [Bacilli bacterium]MDD4808893.1 cyclic lactone autoinducer peptide [Bacilli bacterium]